MDQAGSVGAQTVCVWDVLRKEALEHLDFAIAECRAMKMQPSLERALGRKGIVEA